MDYGFSLAPYEIYDGKCKAGGILSVFNGHEQDFGSGSDVFSLNLNPDWFLPGSHIGILGTNV